MLSLPEEIEDFNSRPHGGRHFFLIRHISRPNISTHALTEGDPGSFRCADRVVISTHALTEGDKFHRDDILHQEVFQLTPSRRATLSFSYYFIIW